MNSKSNSKDGKGSGSSNDLNAVPERKSLPNLPNLAVAVGEAPELATEILKIRIKRAEIAKLFREVLGDERNGHNF